MNKWDDVQHALRSGRFAESFILLEQARVEGEVRVDADVTRMELLEHLGRHSESSSIANRLLRNRSLAQSHRSACELCLGLIAWNEGLTDASTRHLQRAVAAADVAGDLSRKCWAQLRLVAACASNSDSQIVLPLLAETRWNVLRLGDPVVTAALHIFVAGMEARRGLVNSARRHTEIGLRLLNSFRNVFIEAIAENNLVGISLLKGDLSEGMARATRALALAEESGDVTVRRACLGNLGNIYCETGHFDRTIEHFKNAIDLLPSSGEFLAAARDSIARAMLLKGDVSGACDLLEQTSQTPSEHLLFYANRHALLTRATALNRLGRNDAALECLRAAEDAARRTDDALLSVLVEIAQCELEADLNTTSLLPLPSTSEVIKSLGSAPPMVHARYERALGYSLAKSGRLEQGESHFRRASRVFEGLPSLPGLLDLDIARGKLESDKSEPGSRNPEGAGPVGPCRDAAASVLQDVASLLMHAGRPELLARDLVAILSSTDSVAGASAVTRENGGHVETLASYGDMSSAAASELDRTLEVGTARDRRVEVAVRPHSDLESLATVHAVAMLVDAVHDLERAQAEREEHLTLWPIEELPVSGSEAIVTGQMRKLMGLAQRVASTNVSVLITGESGTGKEIVARAIHAYSTRANKPFVPFNCTAVPRDLLESQLFGHRRGAFTGAERDYAGLIRTARDGTLFLDEIGEMGLDLQPKLLRFLESGEISPLGEAGPLSVDVRIVAATNANLEDLVRQGRFREDLFYRLNVIRLPLPPLRERRDEIPALVQHFVTRATAEFSKGRVRLAEETLDHLVLHEWPGNVRQLQNEVRRMVALAEDGSTLTPEALSPEVRKETSEAMERQAPGTMAFTIAPGEQLPPAVNRIEREMIQAALRAHDGRVDAAARALGISRKGLYLKRQRLGL